MRRHTLRSTVVLPVVALGLLVGGAGAQQHPQEPYGDPVRDDDRVSARIWFDQGEEPMLDRGDRVRVYYRTSRDAYVAIFNIDTNGTVRMVFPRSPEDEYWARGGRDYRLLFPRSPYWYVDDQPGLGYYFVVASPEPFDFSRFEFSYYERGWDLTRVGRNVYGDPYVAMDDYVTALIPDWEYAVYGLDFATYHVGRERYDYPRFLCYDCHGFRSYASWNPYHYYCTQFRVVIYDDPWYYPSYRYSGTRVVYANIPRIRLPRFEFKERAADEAGPPLIATRATSGPRPGPVGDGAPRRSLDGTGSGSDTPGVRPGTVRTPQGTATDGRPGLPSGVTTPRRGSEPGSGAVGSPDRGATPSTSAPSTPPRRSPIRVRPSTGAETGTPTGEPRYVPVLGPRAPREEGTSEGRSRPVLERRPTRGGGAVDTGGARPRERPSAVIRPPARGGSGPTTGTTGGTARRGSGGATVPTARPTAPSRPSAGTGGNTVRTRPTLPVKPRGGGTAAGATRPSVRPRAGRSSGTPPPPVRVKPRSGGSGGSAIPSRSRGGSTPSRTPPPRVKSRSGGSSASGTRSPPTRPPPKRRGGGGGG